MNPAKDGETLAKGCCPLDCPDTCAWVATIENGKATKLMGARDHPYTRGALCVKVSKYIDYTRHSDRVTAPLIRTGKKGSGEFRRASWDEALGLIAERFQKDIDQYGGESIWPHMLTGHFGFINGIFGAGYRLFNYLGASQNAVTNCSISGDMGIKYTVGYSELEPMAIRHANLIILWGTNTISTNQHLRPFLEEARRERGAKIICIDPVRTKTAEFADEHVMIRPGTDGALAFGIMNAIVAGGLHDQAFIDTHTIGWDQLRPRIEAFSTGRAADITGIPEAKIIELAERIASAKPCAIRTMQGLQRHGGGGMAIRAIACIPSITGDWQYPGGGFVYSCGGYFKANFDALHRPDLRKNKDARVLPVTRTAEALLDLKDPPVKSLFVWSGNPLVSAPDTGRIKKGMERDDLFTVVADHFMTETARYADVFLPCTMQLEHDDLHRAWGHLYVAWNQKAVDPPGDCLPMAEIFRRLARKMGLEEPALYASDAELAEAALSSDHDGMKGITLDRLQKEGFLRQNYSETLPRSEFGFTTPSGKIEFYSEAMKEYGFDPVPTFAEPYEALSQDRNTIRQYPFALVTPASHYFLNSVFANFAPSTSRQGEQSVSMNMEDASEKGLRDGELVRVHNARGAYHARLIVTEGLPRGVVASPKGQWSGPDGTLANVNAVVAERDSDMGQGAVFNDNRVDVTSIEPASSVEQGA